MDKKYKCGIYLGRFQPIHNGHLQIIKQMLKECELSIIIVGSSNKSHTQKNPFDFYLRRDMIHSAIGYQPNCIVFDLPDRPVMGNNSDWGDYVFEQIFDRLGKIPDVIFQGEETERKTWFEHWDVPIVNVPRDIIAISATEVRNAILDNDTMKFSYMVPSSIFTYYNEMRKILKEIENAKQN